MEDSYDWEYGWGDDYGPSQPSVVTGNGAAKSVTDTLASLGNTAANIITAFRGQKKSSTNAAAAQPNLKMILMIGGGVLALVVVLFALKK